MPKSRRGGSVFLLALILIVLILVGLTTSFFLVREERFATVGVVRTLRATAVAHGVHAFIVSMVNGDHWERRFYLQTTKTLSFASTTVPPTFYTFTSADSLFDDLVEEADRPYVEFFGVIKDLDALAQRYRIWIEIDYMGERMTFSYDKKFSESLLGALNHAPNTLATAAADSDPRAEATAQAAQTSADLTLDAIKDQAVLPPKLTRRTDLYDELRLFREQEPLRNLKPELDLQALLEAINSKDASPIDELLEEVSAP